MKSHREVDESLGDAGHSTAIRTYSMKGDVLTRSNWNGLNAGLRELPSNAAMRLVGEWKVGRVPNSVFACVEVTPPWPRGKEACRRTVTKEMESQCRSLHV